MPAAAAVSALAAPLDIAALRSRFRDGKKALIAHFLQSRATAPAAARLVKALTRHVDAALAALWAHAGLPASAALVAVGGYGRGELMPHSDVDVLVLLPAKADTSPGSPLKDRLETFITACWDIGLEVGSSVRNVAECVAEARADVTVQTALLESRLIVGARKLFADFQRETSALMMPRPSCAPSRWKCTSATPSTRTRPTRWSPTARRAPAACVTCRW